MSDNRNCYDILPHFARQTLLNTQQRQTLYEQSIAEPNVFWGEQANKFISWSKTWEQVHYCDFKQGDIRWFTGAKLNVSYNCIDRHLADRGDQVALIWEGDDPKTDIKLTYYELHEQVCRLANALKARGVKKGDRICIYLPMVPAALFAMLACARIGAIHSVVFGGFSAESLRSRILDADCSMVITADEGIRGGRKIPLKVNTDNALQACPNVHTVVVLRHTAGEIPWQAERDVWYHDSVGQANKDCPPVEMDAEDPLFILYTSGSTGKPKGVLHTTGGYLLYAAMTHRYVFDYHPGEIYWCSADVGWITGHSYIVYGPLANGATTLMFEGVPSYPTPARFWEIIDKHQVNIFYTAPTAIRALIREGDDYVKSTSRKSLKLLGTVGEPIDEGAWQWYYNIVGEQRCPIVDTWWQTETGGILITPLPGAIPLKPGSATLPFFGILPALMDKTGQVLEGAAEGELVITRSWPGQMRGIYGDQQRFIKTYFTAFPGYFMTGDNARRDEDGYYWISGRADDVINVSGHRLDTAEIESAINTHPDVAETAVVGYPHKIKGQGIYAYVTLLSGKKPSTDLELAVKQVVRERIGAFATPDVIQWSVGLPKTRSGKIMRRILRKIAANDIEALGDISTLADVSVVDQLVKNRKHHPDNV